MDAIGPEEAAPDMVSSQQSTTASSSSVAQSPLFKLPRELRDYIYDYTFCSPHRPKITKHGGIPEPALLSACKIIREEANGLFYGRNRLKVVIDSYDPTAMMLWIRKKILLKRAYGVQYASPSYHHTGARYWSNLKLFLRLHHSGHIGRLFCPPPGSRRHTDEGCLVMGLSNAVKLMEDKPWTAVEAVLDTLRLGLVIMDLDWALEQTASFE